MVKVGKRLRTLREGIQFSQAKLAGLVGTSQVNINRYESGSSFPPAKVLLWYADYFDVSLDYIFGRTDQPQGKLYNYQPQVLKEKVENNEELKQFIEMCFDPASPMNDKLKQALMKMIEEAKE